jgi:hypothetical protein
VETGLPDAFYKVAPGHKAGPIRSDSLCLYNQWLNDKFRLPFQTVMVAEPAFPGA